MYFTSATLLCAISQVLSHLLFSQGPNLRHSVQRKKRRKNPSYKNTKKPQEMTYRAKNLSITWGKHEILKC